MPIKKEFCYIMKNKINNNNKIKGMNDGNESKGNLEQNLDRIDIQKNLIEGTINSTLENNSNLERSQNQKLKTLLLKF